MQDSSSDDELFVGLGDLSAAVDDDSAADVAEPSAAELATRSGEREERVRADDEDDDGMGYLIERAPVVASASAGRIFVVGGELATYGLDSRRRVDAYDPATDTWSQLEDRPTLDRWENGVEVNGKLYFYNNDEDGL